MIRTLVLFAFVLLAAHAAVYQLKMDKHEGQMAKMMKEGKLFEVKI
jgi:hypothetical protein